MSVTLFTLKDIECSKDGLLVEFYLSNTVRAAQFCMLVQFELRSSQTSPVSIRIIICTWLLQHALAFLRPELILPVADGAKCLFICFSRFASAQHIVYCVPSPEEKKKISHVLPRFKRRVLFVHRMNG